MIYDIIIIGGGPAGLTAAVYARRANKTVLVIDKGAFGGQITFSPKVENIPGFAALSGNEFAEKLVDQVMAQGADFESCEVLSAEDHGDYKTIHTDSGDFDGKTVILATGARHRTLGLPNEERFIGEGISFCAVCDGAFYKDRTVAVVGGGNSALQEAILLADTAKKVYIVQNLAFLTGEKKLCEQVESKPNVEILLETVVDSYNGESTLSGLTVKKADGSLSTLTLDGVFLAVGLVPQNEIFEGFVKLDERGYIAAGEDCLTDVGGVYAAGDCRAKRIRQVTTASADGAVAALAACAYLDEQA